MTTAIESVLTKRQRKKFGPIALPQSAGYGKSATITAEVRYDDECGNGHNTFSITAEIRVLGNRDVKAYGCLHEEVTKHIPQLAPYIKWHLCSSDGPMHYPGNAIYHAGDRDCWGLRKDEFRQMKNKEGVPLWEPDYPPELQKYDKTVTATDCPAPVLVSWKPYGTTGKGKERELDAARHSAIWPDATDEELTDPGLKERLEARLPALMEEFRKAVESLGFVY